MATVRHQITTRSKPDGWPTKNYQHISRSRVRLLPAVTNSKPDVRQPILSQAEKYPQQKWFPFTIRAARCWRRHTVDIEDVSKHPLALKSARHWTWHWLCISYTHFKLEIGVIGRKWINIARSHSESRDYHPLSWELRTLHIRWIVVQFFGALASSPWGIKTMCQNHF